MNNTETNQDSSFSREHDVKISDWLQYLEHVANINSIHMFSFWSNYFVILAVLISSTALLYSVNVVFSIAGVDVRVILGFVIFIVAVYVVIYSLSVNYWSKNALLKNTAENILKDFFENHKYRSVEEIENHWLEELKRIGVLTYWIRR